MATYEEIEKFEQENGTSYIDLFAERDDDPIQGTNSSLDGKTIREISQAKDIAEGIGNGIYGGIRSLVELAAIPTYKVTSKLTTGDWGDFEKEAESQFNTFMPQEAETQTTAGNVVQGLSKFATTTFMGGSAGKAIGLTGKSGAITNASVKLWSKSKDGIQVGKILAPALNVMVGDSTAFWQDKENLSSIINKNVNNPYIKQLSDYLSIKEDDDVADRMLKQGLEGLFTAGAANAFFKVFKGIKRASSAAIKEARLARSAEEFAKDIDNLTNAKMIKEVPQTAEEIKKAVADGKMIEPSKETIQTTKEVVSEEGIKIPRNPERISLEEARSSVNKRITDLGWADATELNEEQLLKLQKDANNQIEKVMPLLDNENRVFSGGLLKMKEAGLEFANGNITKENRNKYFFDALTDVADAFGKTQDALYESGKTLGYASQSETHKTIKDVLTAITNNADELTKDKIFDIFAEAKTIEELRNKLQKLGFMDAKSFTKNGLRDLFTQITALEQAGLMSNFGTISRNIITSMEMGIENIVSKPLAATVSALKRGLFKQGTDVSGVEFKEATEVLGGYIDAIKDGTEWLFDRITKKGIGSSPWQSYRNSASRQAMTNLPKEVGQTFKGKGPLSSFLQQYLKYSGVGVSEKIDNFFEAMFFRGEAKSRSYEYATRIGRQKNLSDKQIKELYENTLNKVMGIDLTNRKNIVELAEDMISDNLVEYSIAKKAREGAAKSTFRGERDIITEKIAKKAREGAAKSTFRGGRGIITEKIAKTMNDWYIVRPMIPFFKTGSTIFLDRFVGDLTPLGIFSKQFRSAFKKGGREADEAIGKMMLGGGLLGYGYTLAMDGKITGDYSSDPKVRNAQIKAGWQPNSLVFHNDDGTVRYVSLDYLGPLSMALKYPAKLLSAAKDYKNSLKFYEDEKILNKFSAIASAFVADAIDETSLRYFSDGMSLFRGNKADEVLEKMGEGVLKMPLKFIPKVIKETAPIFNDTEQVKQMLDGIGDEFKNSIGMPTDDMYDVFGHKILDKDPTLALFGIKTKEVQEEPWLLKLADEGIGFEMPRTSITINGMTLDITPTQANNIRKEMGDLKVYESLKRICETKSFMESPKEIRKQTISTLFNSFKNNAIQSYFLKDTDLQESMTQIIKKQADQYAIPSMDIGE